MSAAAISAALRAKRKKKQKGGKGDGQSDEEDLPTSRSDTREFILPYQHVVHGFYGNQKTQIFVAILIGANFLTNIVEKEVDPFRRKDPDVWQTLEDTYNVIFLIELLVNFYGSFFLEFWKSGWNIFDLIVVTVGCLSLLDVQLGPLEMLRMLRAFRVFRLFKRIQSLNKIMTSLGRAVPGVINAFGLMLIFMCIYAILAVDLFANFGEGGVYYTNGNGTWDDTAVDSGTARGFYYGAEYYGTFFRALFTLFQVLTGESWAEAVARPLLFGSSPVVCALFFITYILLVGVVLINVVVAVLLDKMVAPDPPEGEDAGLSEASVTVTRQATKESVDVDQLKQSMEEELKSIRAELASVKEQLADLPKMKEALAALPALIEGLAAANRPPPVAAPTGPTLTALPPLSDPKAQSPDSASPSKCISA